jgi:hypothetical protein
MDFRIASPGIWAPEAERRPGVTNKDAFASPGCTSGVDHTID